MNDTELTVRDVLHQIDRRLILIESDARAFREESSAKLDSVFHVLDGKIDRNFRWTLSVLGVFWVSTIAAVVLK